MFNKRIIPTLLIEKGKLVKTENFKSPIYVGDPINIAKIFNEKQVDELVVIDIGATKLGHPPNFELIGEIASECFMPVSYGGGIKRYEDAEKILRMGVEKVIVQDMALNNSTEIMKITEVFGVQSVIVSFDVTQMSNGEYCLYSRSRLFSIFSKKNVSLVSRIRLLDAIGVGEYLITSVKREGTLEGLDLNLIETTSSITSSPIIYAGGASSLEDISRAFSLGAHAISAGRLFTLHGDFKAVLVSYPKRIEIKNILNENL